MIRVAPTVHDNASFLSRNSDLLRTTSVSKAVHTRAGNIKILENISLHLNAGESLAILGPSGSGKTTFLSLCAGIDLPSSGEVCFRGQSISALSESARTEWRRKNVGFVFQYYQLFEALTALENIMLPIELSGGFEARAMAKECLAYVGLEQRGHHYPGELSGGEQQRVAVARALVTKPALLICDEPTASLDRENAARVNECLFGLSRIHGAAVLIATHDEDLAAMCERTCKLGALRDLPLKSVSPSLD